MSLIQHLDLITVVVDDADRAFADFSERLGLPTRWEPYDAGPYRSGAVHAGNVDLEVLQPSGDDGIPPIILSFEPASLEGVIPELDNRGLHHGGVIEIHGTTPDGSDGTLHTEVVMQGEFAGGDEACRIRLRTPAFEDPRPVGGSGKAGILGIERARIGTDDGAATIEIWQRMMVPILFDGTTWTPDDGPHIGVEGAEHKSLVGFFAQARSIDQAAEALGVDADECREGVDVEGLRLFFY